MTYSYPNYTLRVSFIALFIMLVSFTAQAQTASELVFSNPSLISGTDGNNGATYRFPSVQSGVDALVKITDRSSSKVKLVSIDVTSTGWAKAFQPQVSYNDGKTNSGADWWMQFQVSFVQAGTTTATTVNAFDVTGLDIDGDGDKLNEYLSFYNQSAYTLEQNTQLTVTSLLDDLLGLLTFTTGKKFNGTTTDHSGIDTSATRLMVTNAYKNVNSFTVRTGAKTTNGSDNTSRQYSMFFKGFTYQSAIVASLPVKLINWNATYNNNAVSLKWATTQEINTSHFIIERSSDGVEYSDAAMIFATGNSETLINYSYNDKIPGGNSGVLYYRLRSVDMDGRSTVSETRIIRLGTANANAVKIATYPNPVQSELRITVPANWQDKSVVYQLVNTNGQAIKTLANSHAGQTEVISMSQVPVGMYIVKVTCGNETGVQAIVKQ